MNNPHQNARLTLHGREQIVARVGAGQTASEAAAAFAVSVRTVRKWLARFRAGGGATAAKAIVDIFGTPATVNEQGWLAELRNASDNADPRITARSRAALRGFFGK